MPAQTARQELLARARSWTKGLIELLQLVDSACRELQEEESRRDSRPVPPHQREPLLRKKSLAEKLGVSVSWIEQRMPHIPHRKMGPHPQSPLAFELSKVKEWIEAGLPGYEPRRRKKRPE